MSLFTAGTIVQADFTGMIWPSIVRTARTDSLLCDGSAVSRTGSNANLFAAICPSSTVTITIASPAVITWTAHPLDTGDTVVFSTTGALPTGLVAGTLYYVSKKDANSFWVFDTKAHALTDNGAGTGTGIKNTSGSQSGTQTCRSVNFGNGDGSTTFNLPDLRGRALIGVGTGSGLTKRNLADSLGEETHQLTVAEMASHSHTWGNISGGGGIGFANNGTNTSGTNPTSSSGSDTPHNTMQPSVAVYWYIHL